MPIAFTPGEPSGIGPDIAIIYSQKAKKETLLVVQREKRAISKNKNYTE